MIYRMPNAEVLVFRSILYRYPDLIHQELATAILGQVKE